MFEGGNKQLDLFFDGFAREREDNVEKSSGDCTSNGDYLILHGKRLGSLMSMIMPAPVDVVLTNNKSTMVSFKKNRGRISIRLHKLFRHADLVGVRHLASYISKGDKRSSKWIDDFVSLHRCEIEENGENKRAASLEPSGQFHDLGESLDRVSSRYFNGECKLRIGWGRRRSVRRKRRGSTQSRALATYNYQDQVILVNPVLDSKRVPTYMIDWVVYHELLHHVLPIEKGDKGRRKFHTLSFRVLERGFEHYDKAIRWEKDNLGWLLR